MSLLDPLKNLFYVVLILVFIASPFFAFRFIVGVIAVLADYSARLTHYFIDRINGRFTNPDANSRLAQGFIGVAFFWYVVLRLPTEDRWTIPDKLIVFLVLMVLTALLSLFVVWKADNYRREPEVFRRFSRTLYFHRIVKPAWDWVTLQSYVLLWLDRIPVVRPVIATLRDLEDRIHHRRWKTYIGCLFALSLFTLPIQLMPAVVYEPIEYIISAFSPLDQISVFNKPVG